MWTKQIARLTLLALVVSSVLRDVPPVLAATTAGGGQPAVTVAADSSVIDERYGRILDGAYAGSDRLVIYVQDVHCNGGVQRNINRIIQSFDRACAVNKVFVEGAPRGKVDLSLLARYPDSPAKRYALARMMDKGLLSGAEYYALAGGADKLFGIEDAELYAGNLRRLRTLIKNQKDNSLVARRIAGEVKTLARRNLSPELYRLQNQFSAGPSRKRPGQFFERLAREADRMGEDQRQYPDFNRYSKMLALGREIQKSRLPSDREKYFREFQLIKAGFNPQNFLFEQRAIAAAVLARKARQPLDQDMLLLSRMSSIFSDLVSLKASSKDCAYFREHELRFYLLLARYCGSAQQRRALGILRDQELVRFYTLNLQRDDIFVRSILGSDPAEKVGGTAPEGAAWSEVLSHLKEFKTVDIVVAGGFHDGMTKLLGRSSVSFLTVMPAVDAIRPADEALYRGLVTGNVDIGQVVEAAYKDPLSLLEDNSFTGKFFIDLLILIQSGKHFKLANENILQTIAAWKERASEGRANHPLSALDVLYDNERNEWVIKIDNAEMVRAEIAEDGSAIARVAYYGRGSDGAHPAAAARERWESAAALLAEGMGIAASELIPSFIIRDNGDIDGFAAQRRAPRAGFDLMPEEYVQSMTMDTVREHVAAGGKVVFVMGHNNPDNDALFSAVIKSYLLSRYAGEAGTLYVPLMCVIDPRNELTDEQGYKTVTTEVLLACRELNLDLSKMIQSRHVAQWLNELTDDQIAAQTGIMYVDIDKPRLPEGAGLERMPHIGTDDHHPDFPDNETTDLFLPMQIHHVGATLSIIARWARFLGIPMSDDAMRLIVRMMPSGILDDTKGLVSDITRLVDVFSTNWYARLAQEDPAELFRKQNEIHEHPTTEQVVADWKDSYHKSVVFAQHMVRRVVGSDLPSFGVENKMREEIFTKMADLMKAGSAYRSFYNAYILMMTCIETGETRLWIVTNDEPRSEMAVMKMLKVLRKTYHGARKYDVPGGVDGVRRYEITGLMGLTTRKEMVPLLNGGKKSLLAKYWPIDAFNEAVAAADDVIAEESPRFFGWLFGDQPENIRQMELIVDGAVNDEDIARRRELFNSWRLAPLENNALPQKAYNVYVDVPLAHGKGTVRVALAISNNKHILEYWIIKEPPFFDATAEGPYLASEDFRYRVAVAFFSEIHESGSAADYTGRPDPVVIAHSRDFVPPADIFPFPVRVLQTIEPDQPWEKPVVDPDAISSMNSAA